MTALIFLLFSVLSTCSKACSVSGAPGSEKAEPSTGTALTPLRASISLSKPE